jgi:hypothetical protein
VVLIWFGLRNQLIWCGLVTVSRGVGWSEINQLCLLHLDGVGSNLVSSPFAGLVALVA